MIRSGATIASIRSLGPIRPLARLFSALHALRRSPSALAGFAIIVTLVAAAVLAPAFAPYDPEALGTGSRLAPPTWSHPLGTDQLGRDILSRVLYGGRVSLTVGFAVMGLGVVLGGALGLVSGYGGGWVDLLTMRLIDIQLSFPFLILALLIVVVLGGGTASTVWALGIAVVPLFARLVRAVVLELVQKDFVLAARALGAGHGRIMLRHLLPNCLAPAIVTASLVVSTAILAEATLSFLGMGTQPPAASWGLDLKTSLLFLEVDTWLVVGPGAAIVLAALGLNLLGDGLRDILDPRLH